MFSSSSERREIARFVKRYGEFQCLAQKWEAAEEKGNLTEESFLYLQLLLAMDDKDWSVIS